MKDKLAIIIPSLHGAGCERLLSQMLFYFEKEFVIDLILYEKIINYEIPKNINIKLVGTDNSPNHNLLYKILRLWKRIYNLGKILKANEYDIILSFLDGCNVNVYIGKILHRVKTPLIATEHTINEGFFTHNKHAKKLTWLYKFLLKVTYNGADHVVVISESMKKYLKDIIKITNKNITTIYYGSDTNQFNLNRRVHIEYEEEFKNSKIRLLNVARLDDQKNQQYLINLIPDILKEKPDVKLFIIGKGEKEKELKELIVRLNLEGHVFLIGWKENVADYMKESDLFLMSSHYESFGNVIVESLMCGLPVVTSKYDDVVYDIINSDNLGKVVETINVNEFKNAIFYYLDKQIDKEKINNLIKDKFSIIKTSQQYIKIIKEVIKY
jgi:glycosyltransferase involved in cell wall biosynthesis